MNSEKGTGIVHIAPSFGEDDFNLCLKHNILDKEFKNLFLPVNINGNFTDEVEPLVENAFSKLMVKFAKVLKMLVCYLKKKLLIIHIHIVGEAILN